jgi:hypothetical protein
MRLTLDIPDTLAQRLYVAAKGSDASSFVVALLEQFLTAETETRGDLIASLLECNEILIERWGPDFAD